MISIFVAGDVMPIRRTTELFENKRITELFGSIIPSIKKCDYGIVNLEAPIVSELDVKAISKIGPCLKTSPFTLEVIKEAGFSGITLANNHFFDYGQEGVNETLSCAEKLGLDYVGAGANLFESRRILYKEIHGVVVAFVNVCEHEFSVADKQHGGTNGIDIINTANDIIEAKNNADYVLCIVHGGIEYYQLPTPRMKRWYHHFINIGADAVINHHQHCLSGYELYHGKPIFYGLGNFNFDSFFDADKHWFEGYSVILDLEKSISFRLIPYIQNANTVGITVRDYSDFAAEIEKLNTIISDDTELQKRFDEYCLKQEFSFKQVLLPSSRILKALYRRGFLKNLYDAKSILSIKNKLLCESHLEPMARYFELITK